MSADSILALVEEWRAAKADIRDNAFEAITGDPLSQDRDRDRRLEALAPHAGGRGCALQEGDRTIKALFVKKC